MLRLLYLLLTDLPPDAPADTYLPAAVVVAYVVTWVLGSDQRTTRLVRLLEAARRRRGDR